MAGKDRIDCYLVVSVTTGHEPEPEIDFGGLYRTRDPADAKKREIEESTGSSGIAVAGTTVVDVLPVSCGAFGPPPPDEGALVIGVNDYVNSTAYALQVDDPVAAERIRKLGDDGEWDEVLSALDGLGEGKAHIVASTSPAGTAVDFLVERS